MDIFVSLHASMSDKKWVFFSRILPDAPLRSICTDAGFYYRLSRAHIQYCVRSYIVIG